MPVCVRKGLPVGVLQRTCVQGPGLVWGQFFLWSCPTLLGHALNTIFGPSVSLSGDRVVPVNTLGWSPVGLSLQPPLAGWTVARCDRGRRGPGAGPPAGWPRGLSSSPATPFLSLLLSQTPFLSFFFIRISSILWGHKPIILEPKGCPN